MAAAGLAYAAWLLALGRTQWFVTDEFAYFAGPSDAVIAWLWAPHNEHTLATTKLWFNAWFPIIGLRHYVIYLVPLVAAHLVAIAAIYRLTWIASSSWVVAAGAALLVATMGAGAGTLTWAGPTNHVGSMAAGLVALLLAFEPRVRARTVAVAALALFGTVTGTAFVAIGLAAAAAFAYRRRWTEAVLLVSIPVIWQLVGRVLWAPSNPYAASGVDEVLRLGPSFTFRILDTAISQTFGGAPVTAAVIVALVVGVLVFLSERRERQARQIVGALALATLLALLALVVGRLGLSQSVATGGGYSYPLLVTIIPLVGVMAGTLARSKASLGALVIIVVAISVVGVGRITDAAKALSVWKLQGADLMQASALLLAEDVPVFPDQLPAPDTAPTVTAAMIRFWVSAGRLDPRDSGQLIADQASLNLQWRINRNGDLTSECRSLDTGEQIHISPDADVSASALEASAALAVSYTSSAAVRRFEVEPAGSTIQSVASQADAIVTVVSGSARVCTGDASSD